MAPTITPDPVATALAPQGKLKEPAISFRGFLAPRDGDVHRLFTSLWFDEWLEIKADDLLFQQPGSAVAETASVEVADPTPVETADETSAAATPNLATADGASVVWVKSRAQVNRCHAAEACEIAEQDQAQASEDPTSAYPTAVRPQKRRYGG